MSWLRNSALTSGTALLMLLFGIPLLAAQDAHSNLVPLKPDYAGMYSFLQEGEFVQITIEDDGRVTGYISRFSEAENERGSFVDQFFKQAKLEGKNLAFTTETAHDASYVFKGVVQRGDGKNPGDEAYYVLRGTLTENRTGADKKTTSKSSEVAFKSFPQDLDSPAKSK
jgi:hypothetical protein